MIEGSLAESGFGILVTVVETIDPETMVTLTGNPKVEAVALEVRAGLKAALERVAES